MGRRFRPTDNAAAREADGELVVLDLERGEFFVARGVARAVWKLLASGRTVEEIVEAIASRYGMERGAVRADVESFVQSLETRGLIAPG